MLVNNFVGRAERTDADGRFTIRLEDSYFEGLFGERNPDLYFRIFDGGALLARTAPMVRPGRPRGAAHKVVVEVEILVDRLATVETPGRLRRRAASSAACAAPTARRPCGCVQAHEVRNGERRLLGEVLTDPEGRYVLALADRPDDERPGDPMSIVVQVSDPLGAVLASTGTQVPPRADAAVDIVLGKPWRPAAGVPGRLVDQCHLDLPSDNVVDRMEFVERFFRLNAAYGDLMDKPPPVVINLPPQPGTPQPVEPEAAPNPLDIRSLPLAFHLPFTQTWKLEGYTRGRMVNSFALAPGEEQTVDVFTWDRLKSSPRVDAVVRAGTVDRGLVDPPRRQRCHPRRRAPERLRDDDPGQGGLPGRCQRRPED